VSVAAQGCPALIVARQRKGISWTSISAPTLRTRRSREPSSPYCLEKGLADRVAQVAFDDGPQLGVHGDLGIEIDLLGPFADVDALRLPTSMPRDYCPRLAKYRQMYKLSAVR
jgi:hypothetical protein